MHSQSKSSPYVENRPLYLALPSLGSTVLGLGLLLLTLFHVWLAGYLPPAADELYYWAWSQSLQPSYFDHPPLTAYFIRCSTALFGDSILAIRLPAILVSVIILFSLILLTPRSHLALLLCFCPIVLFGCVLMTPDLPLILFWTLYVIWFAHTNRTLDGWNNDPVSRVYHNSPVPLIQWILGGILLGLGGLGKYTMFLAVPCALTTLATRTRFRAWGAGFALHLLVAGVLLLPVFVFNWRHDFAPLIFQWKHAMSQSGFSFGWFFKYFADQSLLLGALPFLMLPWIVLRGRELCSDPRSQTYFWFFVLPFSFFLYKALRSPLEANWGLIAYVTFWPLADRLLSWNSFKGAARVLLVLSFGVPWVTSIFTLVHLFSPLSHIAPGKDRVGVLDGQYTTAQEVAREIEHRHLQGTLFLPNYQWTSYFRYLRVPSDQLVPASRPSHFTLGAAPSCTGRSLLALDTSDNPSTALGCFAHREVLKLFIVKSRGKEVSRVWLSRYYH